MSTEPGAEDEAGAVERHLVVVGVSSRTGSAAALRWAVQEAHLRGGRVRAVLAWRPPRTPVASGTRPPAVSAQDPEVLQEAAERKLAGLVHDALGDEDAAERVAARGSARAVLLRESREADLLVLDSPRAAKLATPGAKLLAPQLVYAAHCPVVVMPPPVAHGGSVVRQAGQRLGQAAAAAVASAGRPGIPPRPP
ncbi:universal stress protein, partial [Kineococcus glutinatus]|uniref:universal stress protein n=1 Tax=Kineococcus glutinatus TaxID=1070872 RepID=UPI0031EE367F